MSHENIKEGRVASVKESIGPFAIRNPEWPLGVLLSTRALGRDDVDRVYAVGYKEQTFEHYLVRLCAEVIIENDADIDLEFGENGFVPIVAGDGLLTYRALQIVEITAAHLTLCFEVLDEDSGLFQTALFRFLIDGRVDTTFGVNGFALFPELPEPSLPRSAVSAAPRLESVKQIDGQAKSQAPLSRVLKARHRGREWLQETAGAVPGANGKALANGQILLVAHKRGIISEKFSYLIRVNEDGTLDSSFAAGVGYLRLTFTGSAVDSEYRMSADSRDRAVVVSESEDETYCLAVRFTANGALDPGFGGTGIIRISSSAGALHQPLVKFDSNDKAVISVCYRPDGPGMDGAYLFRLDENGASDPAFNSGNPIEFVPAFPKVLYRADNIDIDEQQRIVLRGVCNDLSIGRSLLVSRFTAQGIDASFGESGSFALFAWGTSGGLTIQPGLAVIVSDSTYLWKLVD